MRNFTMEDNCISVGYTYMAMEIYNHRIDIARQESDYQDECYNMHMLTEDEMRKILSCMYAAFDRYSEEEAFRYRK